MRWLWLLAVLLAACGPGAPPTATGLAGDKPAVEQTPAPGATSVPAANTPGPGTPTTAPVAPTATEVPDRRLTLKLGDRTWDVGLRQLGFRVGPGGALELGDGRGLDELLGRIAAEVEQP